jgi:membrane protein YqaA with SNARE-associated domain
MAVVIISCAICSVFGGSLGFLLGAICTMASDKNQQAEGEVKSSVGKRSIVLPGTPLLSNGGRP